MVEHLRSEGSGSVPGVENVWLERRVLNYAHQGGAAEAPSSTLFALAQAVEVGADALELDVHATADGELVVCHDATVDATTESSGAIADMTMAEVSRLDNGYRFSADDGATFPYRGRGFGVATLRSVLEQFPSVFLNLDIKQTAPDVKPYESALAALLREFTRVDDVIVASFNDAATDAFSGFAPEIAASAGTIATAAFWQAVRDDTPVPDSVLRHAALQVPPNVGETVVVSERFVTRAHEAGLAVHVWTIDDADEMRRLIELGVDGVMTDRPSVLESVVQDLGCAFDRSTRA
jgi:glycerophosphoryl diester phosphodiesterase